MSSAYPPNQRGEEHYSYTQWAGDHEQPQAYSTPHTYSAHTQQYQYAYPQVDYSHGGDLGTGTGNGGGPSGLEVQKPAAGYSSSDVSVKEDEDVPAENEKLPSSSPPLNYVPKIEFPPEYTEEDKHKEAEFMQNGLVNWDDVKNWRTWIRKEWWHYYLILAIIAVLVILMTVFHTEIVTWCKKPAEWMRDLKAGNVKIGWLIPIAILFVISFPPLFGHEIVAMLCGIVWGLWIGFGIVAAGTFLGEMANYIVFKYWCMERAHRAATKSPLYMSLHYIMGNSGILLVIVARLSAIPGHLTTAVFATCGMSLWVFTVSLIITLPKQLITVYLGVIFNGGEKSSKEKAISYSVLAGGVVITIAACFWIGWEMHRHRLAAYRQIWFENHKKGGSASVHKLGAVAADPEALPLVAQTSNVSTSQFPSQNNNPYDPVAPRPRPQYNNSNHAQYTPQYNEYSDPYAKAPYNPAPFGTDTSSYSRNGYHHQQAGNATSYPTPLPYRQ